MSSGLWTFGENSQGGERGEGRISTSGFEHFPLSPFPVKRGEGVEFEHSCSGTRGFI